MPHAPGPMDHIDHVTIARYASLDAQLHHHRLKQLVQIATPYTQQS